MSLWYINHVLHKTQMNNLEFKYCVRFIWKFELSFPWSNSTSSISLNCLQWKPYTIWFSTFVPRLLFKCKCTQAIFRCSLAFPFFSFFSCKVRHSRYCGITCLEYTILGLRCTMCAKLWRTLIWCYICYNKIVLNKIQILPTIVYESAGFFFGFLLLLRREKYLCYCIKIILYRYVV